MENLLEYWVADEKTADSFRKTTKFGSEHLNVGLGTGPGRDDDAPL